MSDTLGTTTWLTVISTVVDTPRPVTLPKTLTILVQGSGAESYEQVPTQPLSLPTSMYLTCTQIFVVTVY